MPRNCLEQSPVADPDQHTAGAGEDLVGQYLGPEPPSVEVQAGLQVGGEQVGVMEAAAGHRCAVVNAGTDTLERLLRDLETDSRLDHETRCLVASEMQRWMFSIDLEEVLRSVCVAS